MYREGEKGQRRGMEQPLDKRSRVGAGEEEGSHWISLVLYF
jgi:hypothetical protein